MHAREVTDSYWRRPGTESTTSRNVSLRTASHLATRNDVLVRYAEQFGNGVVFKRLEHLATRICMTRPS